MAMLPHSGMRRAYAFFQRPVQSPAATNNPLRCVRRNSTPCDSRRQGSWGRFACRGIAGNLMLFSYKEDIFCSSGVRNPIAFHRVPSAQGLPDGRPGPGKTTRAAGGQAGADGSTTCEPEGSTAMVLSMTATPQAGQSCRRLHRFFEAACDLHRRTSPFRRPGSTDVRQLDTRANQLAHFLDRYRVGPGSRVGILLDRSLHTYVALLGVLKAGAAFVPLNISFPADRNAFIARNAGLAAVVTTSDLRTRVEGLPCPILSLDLSAPAIAACPTWRPAERGDNQDDDADILARANDAGNRGDDRVGRGGPGRRVGRHPGPGRRGALLHHLHLGHDGQAQGRGGLAREHLQLPVGGPRRVRIPHRQPFFPPLRRISVALRRRWHIPPIKSLSAISTPIG